MIEQDLSARPGCADRVEVNAYCHTKLLARNQAAAMKSAISDGVSVQSLRMLRPGGPFDAVARESAERDLQGEPNNHNGPDLSRASAMLGDGEGSYRGTERCPSTNDGRPALDLGQFGGHYRGPLSRYALLDLENKQFAATGDSVQLQQVLLNLVMNAMDAMVSTPMNLREVLVSTRRVEGGAIEVMVKDWGQGILPAGSARLFEPFYSTKENGLGLGLSICSTIVEAHGGELTLTNDDRGGAIARFWLPARKTEIH